ncbi:hypothetical protein WMY93_014425 [Mugilogobius chulae]|uniref:Uncharacterized protein n=1 Tax=Mugilogobius chulae TaxID=88201 RepID=A0AAW0NYZ6_9GOBI
MQNTQAEISQTQLKEEKLKSNGLQEQLEALRAAFVKSEQEKMEEKESRRKLQDSLTEKEKVVLSLKTAVAKFQTERKEMQLDFESVEEAVMIFKQSAEEKMKDLSQKLNVKESQTQQLQEKNDSLQKEVQSLTEACKILQEGVVKQAEDKNEEVQSLKTTHTTSEEAEGIVEKEVEQEEVESLKTALDSENELDEIDLTIRALDQQNCQAEEFRLGASCLEKNKKNQEEEVESLNIEKRIDREGDNDLNRAEREMKPEPDFEDGETEETDNISESSGEKDGEGRNRPDIRALDQQIRQAEEASLGASCLEKNKKNQDEEDQRKKTTRTSANQKKTGKQAPQTKTKPASPEPDHDGKRSPQDRDRVTVSILV